MQVYNLGTGKGYSVVEMAKAFEEASGKPVSQWTTTYEWGLMGRILWLCIYILLKFFYAVVHMELFTGALPSEITFFCIFLRGDKKRCIDIKIFLPRFRFRTKRWIVELVMSLLCMVMPIWQNRSLDGQPQEISNKCVSMIETLEKLRTCEIKHIFSIRGEFVWREHRLSYLAQIVKYSTD